MRITPRAASAPAACLLLLLVVVPTVASAGDEELKFTPLFNGKDLAGWHPVNVAPSTFTVKDGVIHSTGVPTGFIRTERQYENFVVELEWMHEKPAGNAGLFVWGHPLPAVGTPFARGIEVQILDDAFVSPEVRFKGLYTGHGDVFPIQGASMKPDRPHPAGWPRCLPSENRAKPAGEWNHYRVEARDGVVSLAVNGKVVSGGSECMPRKGYLCLESEGAPAQFRNIRIAELPPGNPKPEETAPMDEGFTSLYTGVDLSGWVEEPGHKDHWTAADWNLKYDGKSDASDKTLWSEKPFGDFVLTLDWHVPPPGGGKKNVKEENFRAQMRGSVQLRGGALAVPLSYPAGEKGPGRWVRTVITMKGDRLTVVQDGKTEVDGDRADAVPAAGPIGLAGSTGEPIDFASVFVRELR
jgi:hypothetical protein